MTHIHVNIQKQIGIDENDDPIFETVDGYHIDSLEPIDGAGDCLIYPATPYHGFAGVPLEDVYRYKFDDEAHFHEFVPEEKQEQEI